MFTEYIDNRDFPGNDEFPPGPIGYEDGFTVGPFVPVYSAMFPLGQWLGDGLLLYHCYVIFFMNYWVMVFPCLLYAASVVTGIMNIYYFPVPAFHVPPMVAKVGIAYFLICLSLNILLTLMIITRLVLHRRNIRHAMGTSEGTTNLYTTTIIMLVESYALYAIAFILYIVSFALNASVTAVFAELLNGIQVIAPISSSYESPSGERLRHPGRTPSVRFDSGAKERQTAIVPFQITTPRVPRRRTPRLPTRSVRGARRVSKKSRCDRALDHSMTKLPSVYLNSNVLIVFPAGNTSQLSFSCIFITTQ